MRKIALLVIHGIGDQKPFETLDAFLRAFIPVCEKEVNAFPQSVKIQKKHFPVSFGDWSESCVSLISENGELPEMDFYEYYWAHLAERKIGAAQVAEWLVDVARGARKFYDKLDKNNLDKTSNDPLFAEDGEFLHYKYLARMLSLGGVLKMFAAIFSRLINQDVFLKNIYVVIAAIPGLKKWLGDPLEKFLGDVALYCSTDKRSKYYDVRQKILTGSLEKLRFLLRRDDYTDIFLIGHSLGTVVAYDTLARLNREMNLDAELAVRGNKVKGLVTYGSPLDKIAFFFDEQVGEDQIFRAAILSQLYGFRRVLVDERALQSGFKQYFDKLKWLNFWSATDPVSGHLDVYRDVQNIEMDFSREIRKGVQGGLDSHGAYWHSEAMFQTILREFRLLNLEGQAAEKSVSPETAVTV